MVTSYDALVIAAGDMLALQKAGRATGEAYDRGIDAMQNAYEGGFGRPHRLYKAIGWFLDANDVNGVERSHWDELQIAYQEATAAR